MSPIHRFDRAEVRPDERLLMVDGKAVELGARAFDLLVVLLANRDRVMTQDELLDRVWPGVIVEANNLQVQVFALRRVLGAQAIATIPGRGYQFVAGGSVEELPLPTAVEGNSPVAAQPTVPAPEPAAPLETGTRTGADQFAKLPGKWRHHRVAISAVAGSVALMAGLAGYWNWSTNQKANPGNSPQAAAAAATSAGPLSIVVLPFTNLTGDAGQAYVADGLTASLTADLSRIRDAFVINATTAFSYKDKAVSVQQVGQDLGVRFVLQGNVQRSGEKIRINTQLADASSNAQLWTESFEGDPSDLFALQNKVTTRIGNSIGREVVVIAARESETRKGDPKASDLMLRARALRMKGILSKEEYVQIVTWCRESLAREPDNANAMVFLASVLAQWAIELSYQLDTHAIIKQRAEAYDLALKAKALDPHHPGIYWTIAQYARLQNDSAGARRALETALSLDPKNPLAYNNLAVFHLNSGEPRAAIELLTKAIDLHPRGAGGAILSNMGRAHFMLGDNDAALEWLLKAREKTPIRSGSRMLPVYLAMTYALKGDDAKARAMVAELRGISDNFKLSEFEKPAPASPAAYQEWFETKYLSAARKAGLPE